MEPLCEKLGIPIRPWKLQRLIEVKRLGEQIEVSGRDEQLNVYSLFKKVTMKVGKAAKSTTKEPFYFPFKAANVSLTIDM
jgi:hypothetical protein